MTIQDYLKLEIEIAINQLSYTGYQNNCYNESMMSYRNFQMLPK